MISPQSSLLAMLEMVAEALGENLLKALVFVGGCSTAVLVTDEVVVDDIRATDDVDVTVSLRNLNDWYRLQEELQNRGFSISGQDDVTCRMRLGPLKVDFMPDDDSILGFGNRWYREGIRSASQYTLPSGRLIRHLTAPLFLATKFEAYLGRGNDDLLSSHDLEDILIVIDGRPEIIEEMTMASEDVRLFVAEQLRNLIAHRDFDHFLYGNLNGSQDRVKIVRDRISLLL